MVPSSKKDIKGFALYVELASLGVEMVAPITVGACLHNSQSNFNDCPESHFLHGHVPHEHGPHE